MSSALERLQGQVDDEVLVADAAHLEQVELQDGFSETGCRITTNRRPPSQP